MSLLHRVSSFDSQAFERARTGSVTSLGGLEEPRQRKLSFSPFPESWVPPKGPENEYHEIAATEVTQARRILQVIVAVIYCLLAAGVVFGYAAIKPVLLNEGVYRNLCTQDELDRKVHSCYAQEIRLNLMFTVAAVGTNVAALPIGAILDRYGPRLCGIIGSVLLTAGALLFAFAKHMPFDTYIAGYLFLALGGPFIFISSFQLSNAFPKRSGLILALLTGAFDTSSALFLIYRLIYQQTAESFKPKYFFLLYLVVPVFIMLVQIFIMPKQSYKTLGEIVKDSEDCDSIPDDQVDENEALIREERAQFHHTHREQSEIDALLSTKGAVKQIAQEEHKAQKSAIIGALHGKTVKQQILSPWFVLITLFTVIQMTRINYFVATIRAQYEVILGSYDKAVKINEFFDFALPLGGVISIPFIGTILDKTSTVFVLASLVTIATMIGTLGCLPYEWAAYANICLFVVYRPFYYTAVSDYAAKVFGFDNFGTVYGLIICLAGLFNFSQSGLDFLLHRLFNGNPIPNNLILMGIAVVVGVALVGFVAYRAYYYRRDALVEEAEDAQETQMPGYGTNSASSSS